LFILQSSLALFKVWVLGEGKLWKVKCITGRTGRNYWIVAAAVREGKRETGGGETSRETDCCVA
jgi:hypothetical protein